MLNLMRFREKVARRPRAAAGTPTCAKTSAPHHQGSSKARAAARSTWTGTAEAVAASALADDNRWDYVALVPLSPSRRRVHRMRHIAPRYAPGERLTRERMCGAHDHRRVARPTTKLSPEQRSRPCQLEDKPGRQRAQASAGRIPADRQAIIHRADRGSAPSPGILDRIRAGRQAPGAGFRARQP